MQRLRPSRLGWASLAVLAGGSLAALAARLLLPRGSVLTFGFAVDPAVLLLLAAVAVTAVLWGLHLAARRSERRLQAALSEQAAALDAERRRFIQRLDHELKNPLTAIQVQLDNLQEVQAMQARALPEHAASEGAPPPQAANAVSEVRAQVGRLILLTRGLRRLADLETRPLEIETVEVGELLEEVNDLLQCPDRLVLDVQRVPWPIPPIQADRELLLMVFRNLVDNALKYSTGTVQVRARHTAGQLVVEVIDTGRGIQADELPLVVGELYRGSNTRDVAGSGLGLAIVQRILERHAGRLELQSRLGQGTIATALLPYDANSAH